MKKFNLVSTLDLNRILKFEIFLHIDRQLHAAHVILGYTLISTHFQSSKNVIKAKNPQLAKIDVAIEGFIKRPPLLRTLLVNLIIQQVSELM